MTNIEPSAILHPGEIALHPLNSNQHSPAHIAELAEGLREFTQYANIAVWQSPETIETEDTQGNPIMVFKLEVTGYFVVLVVIPMGLEVAGMTG